MQLTACLFQHKVAAACRVSNNMEHDIGNPTRQPPDGDGLCRGNQADIGEIVGAVVDFDRSHEHNMGAEVEASNPADLQRMTRTVAIILCTCAFAAAARCEQPSTLTSPFTAVDADDAIVRWGKHLANSGGRQFTNRAGAKMVLIPPGQFVMGSPADEPRRREHEVQRRVAISRPFYLGATEVTQSQWIRIMKTKPWKGKRFVREGDDFPATYMTWDGAAAFCEKLSELDDRPYRLATEAEWEYACRAGTVTAYHFGDDAAALENYGWIGANSFDVREEYAHQVGSKKPNAFGLYDMHGNTWEWCADWYDPAPSDEAATDPHGPETGTQRVIRGGSWHGLPSLCRSANRFRRRPEMGGNDVGFRVVAEIKKE